MQTNLINSIVFFAFGSIVGSFLNVCIYRIPRDKSIVRPGSGCPSCGRPVRFYDNIPILSYVILRARCRHCGASISWRYPAVEILTGVLFAVLYAVLGVSVELAVGLVFVSLLIVISFIDLDFFIIPDTLSLGGLVLGFLLSFLRPSFGYIDSLLGIFVGGGVLFVIAKSYELLRKREGMGGGDIKLLGMIGAFYSIQGVLFSLVLGSLIGSIVGIPLMLIKGKDTKYALPFGPFLSLGAAVFIMAGHTIILALSRFLGDL